MKIKLKPIDQQVVVVFGASSGIGRETALRFGAQRAKVVVAARGEEGLRTLVEEITRAGGEATAITAEATDFAQVQAVADLAVRQYGRLDTWVHAAATGIHAPFERTTPDEFARIIAVNLTGQAHGAMAALPYLRVNGGALIHISSVEALRPLPEHSAYAASKHGVHGFVKTLRMELTHEKAPVSLTEIMPATINTPYFNHIRTKIGVKPVGVPPIYQPGVVADAILYAATHPVRELAVGGAAKAMLLSQRAAPSATDALMTRIGFRAQRTQEPKSEDAPDNLYAPMPGYNRSEGDFSKQARSHSLGRWLATHPPIGKALVGALVVSAVLMARRNGAGDGSESGVVTESVLEVTRVTEFQVAELDGTETDDGALPATGEAVGAGV